MKISQALLNRRMLVTTLLGFSSGIPLAMTSSTLQAWLKREGIDIGTIGLLSLASLPYSLKFIWAPFLDRFVPPFLGHRTGWIFLAQIALVLAMIGLATTKPSQSIAMVSFFTFLVAFFSATQDITVDAYRVDILKKEELGLGASLYITGYRLALLVSGGVALGLARYFSYPTVFLMTAGTMIVGMIAAWIGPEPAHPPAPPKTLQEAVVLPFVSFFKMPGAFEILIFILIYKLDTIMASALLTPFFLDVGFNETEIAAVFKGFGFFATIGGTIFAGAMMVKLGIERSLWVFGIAQAIAGTALMTLAGMGHNYAMLVFSVAAENACSGMGTAAFSAFLMSLCNKKYTATQYALLTSFMALGRTLGQAPAGYLVKALGWQQYFLVSILIAIPGLLMLTRYHRWFSVRDHSHD
jgi:PAT family beta-lactamase induction signal transducer AmpG